MNLQRDTWKTLQTQTTFSYLLLPAPPPVCVLNRVWLAWWLEVHPVWVGLLWSAWWRTEHRPWSWICLLLMVPLWLPVWGTTVPSRLLTWVKAALKLLLHLTTLLQLFVMKIGQMIQLKKLRTCSTAFPPGDLRGRRAGGGVSGEREVR